MIMEIEPCQSSPRDSSKKVKQPKNKNKKESNTVFTSRNVIKKRKLETDKPDEYISSGKKQQTHEKMNTGTKKNKFVNKNYLEEVSCESNHNLDKNINKSNITVNGQVNVNIDKETTQQNITSKVPDNNNAESSLLKYKKQASLNNHKSNFGTNGKHLRFNDDADECNLASCSTDSRYINNSKKSNNRKSKLSSESRATIREEDIKDEDIDEFCDNLDEESNEVYENWIKLLEKKLGPCK